MTDLRKAAEMALGELENPAFAKPNGVLKAIQVLRQALAQPPVDWEAVAADQAMTIAMMKVEKREWVGLTDAEFMTIERKYSLSTRVGLEYFKDELEAKLKEKNT